MKKEEIGNGVIPNIAVRGQMTADVCKKAGKDICLPLGCPSLMINSDLHMGVTVEEKWAFVISKELSGKRLRVVLTVPAGSHALVMAEKLIIAIAQEHEVLIILQMFEDHGFINNLARKYNVDLPARYFVSIFDWVGVVKTYDIVISTRIHGGMAAVAAGVPFFVVATDIRILELAESMAIPYQLHSSVSEEFNFRKFITDVKINGTFFDETRIKAAKRYTDMVESIGLEVNPYIKKLSSLQ